MATTGGRRKNSCLETDRLPRPQDQSEHVFAGQSVGVTQIGERIWLVTFMHDDLGYFDDEVGRVDPPQLKPMFIVHRRQSIGLDLPPVGSGSRTKHGQSRSQFVNQIVRHGLR